MPLHPVASQNPGSTIEATAGPVKRQLLVCLNSTRLSPGLNDLRRMIGDT
jgi:hypothetical protein